MTDLDKQRLARLLVDTGAVRFGRFTTKSGRASPYFINLGAIHRGEQIAELADFYAAGIAEQSPPRRRAACSVPPTRRSRWRSPPPSAPRGCWDAR